MLTAEQVIGRELCKVLFKRLSKNSFKTIVIMKIINKDVGRLKGLQIYSL